MKRYVIPSFVLAVMTLGCGAQPSAVVESAEPTPIYVLHLPGIGGLMNVDRNLTRGLRDGGLEADIEIYDWTNGDRGLNALAGYERNQREAEKIALRIIEFVRTHPRTKIHLSGHSGGAGLLVWALEKLPEDMAVESVLLLAPALSPTYDLSRALRRVRGKAYVFNSEADSIVLGTGTRIFGTIDRVQTDAAGRIGFARPDRPADPLQYEKLMQRPYDRRWMKYGNNGDHIGPMSRSFARHVLAPLLLGLVDVEAESAP